MSRFARNVDANQAAIVKALRMVGCVVDHIHMAGNGVPDLLVGYRREVHLLEIKDGSKVASKQKLSPLELEFHRRWKGYHVHIVRDVEEAFRAVGVDRT